MQAGVAAGREHRQGRYAALDGVRGIAILAVLAFHTDGQWLSGGFLGVDIFFVLSGYLMVGILLNPASGGLSMPMRSFWLRRARRLAPALLTVVLVVVLMQLFVLTQRPVNWRGDVFAALLYVTNWWALASGAEYFNAWTDPSPLLQTWSLGIEEQFYIVLPLVLWVLLKLGVRGRALAGVFALGAAVSAAWAFLLQTGDPLRVYFGTDTRMQALLIGAVLGVVCARPARVPARASKDWLQALGWVSLAGLSVMIVWVRPWDEDLQAWILTASAVLAGLLLWALLDGSATPLARMFAWRPLVWFGGISYALYLWHWPVFLWIQSQERAGLGAQLWSIVLSAALAWVTTRFLESKIRQGSFARRPARLQWLFYALAVIAVAALTLLPFQRTGSQGPREQDWPAAEQLPSRIGLFGDSTAYTSLGGFPRSRYEQIVLNPVTPLGCGIRDRRLQAQGLDPAKPECDGWQERWKTAMDQTSPEATILMEGVWEMYDVVEDGQSYRPGSQEYDEVVKAAYTEALDIVTPAGGGPVYVIGVPCHAAVTQQYAPVLNDRQRQQALNDVIRQVVASRANARFVDLAPLTCGNDGPVTQINGERLRFDGVHWTDPGAAYLWAEVLRQM